MTHMFGPVEDSFVSMSQIYSLNIVCVAEITLGYKGNKLHSASQRRSVGHWLIGLLCTGRAVMDKTFVISAL